MPWPVIYREQDPRLSDSDGHWDAKHIGALYPTSREYPRLSPEYLNEVNLIRPPLMLIVPAFWPDSPDSVVPLSPGGKYRIGNTTWCIDSLASRGGGGWSVSCPWPLEDGQPVALTISPSLDCSGSYHGFIQNGVITDDVEGRS